MSNSEESNSPQDWTRDEQRLQAALRAAADDITPSPDGLARIRERTGALPWWRRRMVWSAVAVGAAGATAIALVVGNQLGPDDVTVMPADTSSATSATSPADTPSPSETLGSEPTSPPTEAPTDVGPDPSASGTYTPPDAGDTSAPEQLTVPVYYVAETSGGLRLVREFHEVSTTKGAVGAAVEAMVYGQPADPDYTSLWAEGGNVTGGIGQDAIEVDFSEMPELAEGTATAELALQQLVYTATAAAVESGAGSLPVRVFVGGEPIAQLFDTVVVDQPLQRAAELEIRQLVQITAPADGATVTSPVQVEGQAAAFEGTVEWEVRTSDGVVVDNGSAQAEECCRFAPFSIEIDLEPGTYELMVGETDTSGGEGHAPMRDTKTFTVR